MLELLRKAVIEAGVADWRISEDTMESHQAFFVRQKLDQHRIARVTHTVVTIYVDCEVEGKKMRGTASHEFHQGVSEEEVKAELEKMKFNASLALNPWFELVSDEKYAEDKKDYQLSRVFETVVKAMQNVNDTATEKINSYEIFVNAHYCHIINSQGVDVTFNSMDEELEVIINSVDGNHEIELYHDVKFADKPLSEITDGILEVFQLAADRKIAVPTKKSMGMTVLMTSVDNPSFFRYFLSKTNTESIYNRMSQVKIGDLCQSEGDCDLISLEIKKELPYSSRNALFSVDGLRARDEVIVEDGVYRNYWGNKTSAYYLGIKDVAPLNNFVVKGGSISAEDMKKEPYLEIIQFSSFIMNPMTGNFGGEIRLGYYFDGEKRVPVTGGSITCSMDEVLKTIRLSRETRQFDNCIVPVTIKMSDIAVAGE